MAVRVEYTDIADIAAYRSRAGLDHSLLADDIGMECMARFALQSINPRSLNAQAPESGLGARPLVFLAASGGPSRDPKPCC
jgi:hypothetical protein